MPSALHHHTARPQPRRPPSSQSQPSLADGSKVSTPHPPSPGSSLVFLPSTTYSQPETGQRPAAAISGQEQGKEQGKEQSTSAPSAAAADIDRAAGDPHDFYRPYRDLFGQGPSPSLHQDALGPASSADEDGARARQKPAVAATGLRTPKTTVLRGSRSASSTRQLVLVTDPRLITKAENNGPRGSRTRKASFRDLVARFDSAEEAPPLPTLAYSSNSSRKPSPGKTEPVPKAGSATTRRPLFGELAPGRASGTLGYGIVKATRRRGSEGSPMHSPNPMFPPWTPNAATQPRTEPHPADVDGTDATIVPASDQGLLPEPRPQHRRAHSDMSGVPSRVATAEGPAEGLAEALAGLAGVDTRRPREQAGRRRRVHSRTTSGSRIPVTKVMLNGDKSAALRANIIAPPPKISPQLRSSRPRLPVSAASTASSRAKMAAEKIQAMARDQHDARPSSHRARPPELSDVDLKARRLRITQALKSSLDGPDLAGGGSGAGSSRDGSRKSSVVSTSRQATPPPPAPATVPVESINTDDGDVFITPDEEHHGGEDPFAQHALSALQGQHSFSADGDSPTLGMDEPFTQTARPQLHTLQPRHDGDPAEISAVTHDTVETTATTFDPEEQVTAAQPPPRPDLSLLTSITSLREQTSASSRSNPSSSDRQFSDHADQESVNIVLRNTTYLDDEEAVAKGYRPFVPPPVPALPAAYGPAASGAASWTSSPPPSSEPDHAHAEIHSPAAGRHSASNQQDQGQDESISYSDHAASDAYTIVNIFIQQHSASGVVDQQLVDDLYQRIVTEQPDLADSEVVDALRVEELCFRELEQIDREWRESGEDERQQYNHLAPAHASHSSSHDDAPQPGRSENGQSPSTPLPKDRFAPPALRAHKYKSSLDSAEDWADTSPSVGDWMKYAASPDGEKANQFSALSRELQQDDRVTATESVDGKEQLAALDHPPRVGPPLDPIGLPIRPPSHSPPPPPVSKMSSIEQISHDFPSSFHSPFIEPPSIPPRLGSASRVPRLSASSRSLTPRLSSSTRSLTPQGATIADPALASEDAPQDQKRLKQRRHVLKELVDTEYTYERDLRVLCDIYKQTAPAALADDDVKVLFGNIEQIQTFAHDFLTYLKKTAKPAYVMERSNPSRARSSMAHADRMSIRSDLPELSDHDKDRQTRLGQAFMGSMIEMEAVYTDYIRTRHAANLRFEEISTNKAVREWLKECRSNSSDITNAWSLDALLVKPIQRITKYPLLLSELIDSTAPDHPDLGHLRQAALEITEVNVRINQVKKHTELVDQVMNRKRKESDVRNGLTKAWGRRAEKLKQHVGINETYEDGEFSRLKMDYDNNCIHLFIVSKDCQGYIEALRSWINRMVEIALCAEAWVDIGHSNNPVAESKLRQLAIAVRGISTIAMPDHVDAVNKKVIAPMDKCKVILERFSLEPKGLIQKREKKLLDYSQVKNKKDRGERLDKRMIERMEQWEAINRETKQRMRKLREATANLVQECLSVLTHLHTEWFSVVQKKLAAAMAIPLDQVNSSDIEKDWQVDFDFYEATALALGICNGSLRNEATNMVSFLAPGSSTLGGGEESPRQSSWNTKRSASLNSASPQFPPSSDTLSFRHSSQHTLHLDHAPESPSVGTISRLRATSLASSRVPRTTTEGPPGRAPPMPKPMAFSRYQTHSFTPPQRPGSSQTFFSAAPTPNTSAPNSAGLPAQRLPPRADPSLPMRPASPTVHSVPSPKVLFTVASMYEFSIDRTRQEAGLPYLTYAVGEIFDVVGEKGELWMARNQDDPSATLGWIWCKHFAMLGG
ncbi:hypothetical protein DV736_g1891, partial [Chaetothyriales sp. CBS 134916]